LCIVVVVTGRPALIAGLTLVVKFQKVVKDIKQPISRPKFFLLSSLSICSIDLTDDGKLGYGFTSADELEEIDIGSGDKPRPTFVSKKLRPCLREPMIALLKEYADCFTWDYTEMPGFDRSIVEHQLPLKNGFRPFQQRARQMKAVLDLGPRDCVHNIV
jgi:hypothetical protein